MSGFNKQFKNQQKYIEATVVEAVAVKEQLALS